MHYSQVFLSLLLNRVDIYNFTTSSPCLRLIMDNALNVNKVFIFIEPTGFVTVLVLVLVAMLVASHRDIFRINIGIH